MTQPPGINDAQLISRTRDGDMSAYDELYRRHVENAAKVARIVTHDSEEAQDVVSEAFTRVLNRLQAGGGPDDELAPYLRTVVRRLAIDRHRSAQRSGPADPATFEIMPTSDDPMARATDQQLVRRAFETLPERWQEVLWHTEIEGRSPASLSPSLGATPNAVAALAYRAREGLRQAYLSINLTTEVLPGCRPFAGKMPALVRGTLPARETRPLLDHLGICGHCRERRDELLVLVSDLPTVLGPALLLPATAGSGIAAGAGAAAGGGMLGWLSPSRWGSKGRQTAVTAAAVAALAALAVAAVVNLTGGSGDPPVAAPTADEEPNESDGPAPAESDPPSDQPPDEPSDQPSGEVPDDQTPAPDESDDPSSSPTEPSGDPTSDPSDDPTDDPTSDPTGEPTDDPTSPPGDGEAPVFDSQPSDMTVVSGEPATFAVTVSGSPDPQVQWQVRAPSAGASGRGASAAGLGRSWTDVEGATGSEFTIDGSTPKLDGREYRAVATNGHGSASSSAAGLTVHFSPQITVHPADTAAEFGHDVVLHAAAEANPAVTAARWQVNDGDGWTNVNGDVAADASTRLELDNADFSADAEYRAVFENRVGTTPTESSAVSVTASGGLRAHVHRGLLDLHGVEQCAQPAGDQIRMDDCGGATWRLGASQQLQWLDGQCLDVLPNGSWPRYAVLNPCTGGGSQQWSIDPADQSRQAVRNADGACLDIKGWRRHDGALAAYHCHGRWNERFTFG